MGLFTWLARALGLRKPPTRDVSRLGGDADVVRETVDTSGGPLKENHLRRALRDPRLLPKPKWKRPVGHWGPPPRRKKHMTADEADRLFSATMRNRDRNIRDLLADPEQLARYGLPLWQDETQLADALGLTVKQLRFFSIHRERETCPHYVSFAMPKRRGGRRVIMAPKRRLKAVQRELVRMLIDRLPVSDAAHGFRRQRSIRSAADPHVGRAVVVCLDIADFFGSVHFGRVRGMLVSLGYGYAVATTLAVLMTEAERQPVEIDGQVFHVPIGPRYCVQGAPTSPGLCNAVFLKADRRLAGLARHLGFAYTRYADDLVFSGDDPEAVGPLLKLARHILRQEGFRVNAAKTRVMRKGRRQRVTGVTVNQVAGLSRKQRRLLRAMRHRLREQIAAGAADPQLLNAFRGRLAFLHMLNPSQAAALALAPPTHPADGADAS